MTPDNQPSFISRFNPFSRDESPAFAVIRSVEFTAIEFVAVLASGPAAYCVGPLAAGALAVFLIYQTGHLEKHPTNELPPWQKWRK